MNTPPFLIGAAALFWGWQTGFWPLGALAAILLEAPRWIKRRFELEPLRQRRIADLCLVLAAMVGVGCYVTYGNPRAIVLLFQWLPLLLLPLGLLQAWGGAGAVRLDVLFWSLRRDARGGAMAVNLGHAYLVFWLIGACAANQRGEALTIGVVALGAWALLGARRTRAKTGVWVAQILLAVALGSTLHVGLNSAQLWLEGAAPDWMSGGGGTRTNPYRGSTDLGSIGELKQSDEIILRVKPDGELGAPLLLHRASYNEYGGTAWLARGARFAEVPRQASTGAWVLREGKPQRRLEIADFAVHGNPLLSLPAGALTVQASAVSMRRNNLGTVQAEAAPGFLIYSVGEDDGAVSAQAPNESDLKLPSSERALFTETARSLGLAGLPPAEVLQQVKRWFGDGFRYSTVGTAVAPGRTALAEFIGTTRAGHCEYFASATVLLLRAAGLPARYATGFSVQEHEPGSATYLVRERHAHAWARVYVDGAWVDLDTTPPGWAEVEEEGRPAAARWRARMTDAWSALRYRYASWQMNSSEAEKWSLFGGIGALVLAWLAWRVFGGARGGSKPGTATRQAALPERARVPGLDSAFYQIEAELGRQGMQRAASETVDEWLTRVARERPVLAAASDLARLAKLHYRYRFDPLGLNGAEQKALAQGCAAWLALQPAPPQATRMSFAAD